jgi:hypothetical protein
MPTLAGLVAVALGVLLTAATPGTGGAQEGRPVRLRGTLLAVEADRLVVETAGAARVTVAIREPFTVSALRAATLADITPGSFVGTAARPQPDGTFRALEVHIFPEEMRGAGEGHRPMTLPDTTMTNATVESVVQQVDGPLLILRYRGGEVRVVVPAEAPVVRFVPGSRELLRPGAAVSLSAVEAADGAVSASRITVGIDVVPPL